MKPNDPSLLLPGLPHGAEILIARLRSLGDIVLETPAIAALHAWRPDLRICVLVEPRFAAVLEGNPAISEILFSRGLGATALELRRRKFPVMFNQHGGPRSALLTAASGSPRCVCWEGSQFSFLYDVHVPGPKKLYGTTDIHTVEHRISQFYWTGLPRGPIPPAQIFPQEEAAESVARKLAQAGIARGDAYAVLQPGSRLPGMRWPVAKFAEIARCLRETHNIASVVNLGARDEDIAAETRRDMSGLAVIEDALDVRELIALIAGMRLFVGNDSGPAHIAAAVQRPSVVIFSVTDPVQWRPWQAEHRVVRTGAVFDHPRGDKSVVVSQLRPIEAITVDEVRAACEELLAA